MFLNRILLCTLRRFLNLKAPGLHGEAAVVGGAKAEVPSLLNRS
jgi:hypothetical protein